MDRASSVGPQGVDDPRQIDRPDVYDGPFSTAKHAGT
jgi:hypothetical protein